MKILHRISTTGWLTVAFLAASSLVFTSATISDDRPVADPPGWEKLGQRKVDRALDRDEIFVTASEGRFTAVKLIVRRSAINLHKVVIHFANGGEQEVAVRNNIPAGGETRVIDINGGKRVIRKVVFWYDTKGLLNDKAVLELWGRH